MSRAPQVRKRTVGLTGAGLLLGAIGGWVMGLLERPKGTSEGRGRPEGQRRSS